MKKSLRLFKRMIAVVLAVALLTGCGSSGSDPKDSAKKTVDDFFTELSKADFTAMNDLFTKDGKDKSPFGDIESNFEQFQDTDTYGDVFVNEANNFIKSAFKDFVTEYKITDVKEESGKYIVSVEGKYLDYSSVNLNSSELSALASNYVNEHKDELQKIYLEKGQDAMVKEVYSKCAKDMFDMMLKLFKDADTQDLKCKFTVVKDDKDNFKIEDVQD